MLEEEELALVHALQETPRASWAALGASLGTDARTVARRYAHLRDAGLLRVTATAGVRLLARIRFAQLRLGTAPGRALGVAERLARWPGASTVRLTDGSSDVYGLLVGAGHEALVAAVHEQVAALPDVRWSEVNIVLETGDVGRAARLDSLSRRQVSELRNGGGLRGGAAQPVPRARLSLGDFGLIGLLLADGRMEVAELARRLGREPSHVSRRLARLQADRLLDFVAITPDSASSIPVRALLRCSVDPREHGVLVNEVAALPWVGLLTLTTGQANVTLIVNLTTPDQLPHIHTRLAGMCPSVRIQETQLSVRAVKVHMGWLDAGDTWTGEVADPFMPLRDALVADG